MKYTRMIPIIDKKGGNLGGTRQGGDEHHDAVDNRGGDPSPGTQAGVTPEGSVRRPAVFSPCCMRARRKSRTAAERCRENAVKAPTASITAALSPSIPDAAPFRRIASWS